MYKETLGIVAIVLTLAAFLPYIRSIHQGKTKPHVFTWIIWGSTTFVVFLAQLSDGGGAGAWPFGVSGIITLYVAYLAYSKKADSSITPIDWVFLFIALISLPIWYITSDPLWTVVILTIIDLAGFGPALRKAYHSPFDEQLIFYVIMAARNIISVLALEFYSLTTALFPASMAAACLIFIPTVAYRRYKLTT